MIKEANLILQYSIGSNPPAVHSPLFAGTGTRPCKLSNFPDDQYYKYSGNRNAYQKNQPILTAVSPFKLISENILWIKRTSFLTSFIILIFISNLLSQVAITGININPLTITPEGLTYINVNNNENNPLEIILEARILNSANEPVLVVLTFPFLISSGLNVLQSISVPINSIKFSNSGQGEFVKVRRQLPSGKFRFCATVKVLNSEGGDEVCEDIDSDISEFLALVSPFDKDTIQTEIPVLIWTHSVPFNILSPGDYYKISVTKLEQAYSTGLNSPIFVKDHLFSHQVQYPPDAPMLEPGGRYAWEVQKISGNTIIDRTEVWEFNIAPDKQIKDQRYLVLKQEIDGHYHLAINNKIYFRFDNSYQEKIIHAVILNDKRERIIPKLKTAASAIHEITIVSSGLNRFMIDLNELEIKSGIYTLEITNRKNEKKYLEFYAR